FAPHMRPTASLGNPVASEQLVEAGIAVSVNDAREFLQMGARMLALAIGRVAEQCRRRSRTAERPFVTHIHHNRPVFVLPLPGASTGTGVSSTCRVSDLMISAASASTSGVSAAVVAPTQPDRVEVSRLTPSRA